MKGKEEYKSMRDKMTYREHTTETTQRVDDEDSDSMEESLVECDEE